MKEHPEEFREDPTAPEWIKVALNSSLEKSWPFGASMDVDLLRTIRKDLREAKNKSEALQRAKAEKLCAEEHQ